MVIKLDSELIENSQSPRDLSLFKVRTLSGTNCDYLTPRQGEDGLSKTGDFSYSLQTRLDS